MLVFEFFGFSLCVLFFLRQGLTTWLFQELTGMKAARQPAHLASCDPLLFAFDRRDGT